MNIKSRDKDKFNIKLGTIAVYISLVISLLNAIILTPTIIKTLGESNYGFYSFSLSISSWLPVLTNALSASFVRFTAKEFAEKGSTIRSNSIYAKLVTLFSIGFFAISILFLSIAFFSGFKLEQYTKQENNLIYVLLSLTSLQSILSIYFSLYTLFLKYKNKHGFVGFLNIFILLIAFILKIFVVIYYKSIVLIVITDIILTLFSGLISLFYSYRYLRFKTSNQIRLRDNLFLIKEILVFSFFIVLNTLSEQINNQMGITILGIFRTAKDVTTYQISFLFSSYLSNIPVAIATLYIPTVNQLVIEGRRQELDSLFLKVSNFQTYFVFLVIGGFIACGRPFINLWIKSDRIDIYIYAILLLVAHSIPLTVNLAIEIQRAYNKHKFRAFVLLIMSLSNLLVSFILLMVLPNNFGVFSVVIALTFTKIIGSWIILNVYNKKALNLPMFQYLKNTFLVLVITIIALLPSIFLGKTLMQYGHIVWFLSSGASFVVCYFLVIFSRQTILKKNKPNIHISPLR